LSYNATDDANRHKMNQSSTTAYMHVWAQQLVA